MSEFKIIKKPDDPICNRVSIGGSEDVGGYYIVYRGNIQDVLKMLEICCEALKKQAALGELPVEDN